MQPVGLLTLNANPVNFFAETEQVAFHLGHLVPGIDVTDDPLLQGRLFSYLDTQLTRLGGPNFAQLPINRPHAPVNDMLRDGMHQTAVHAGRRAVPAELARRRRAVHRGRRSSGGYVEVAAARRRASGPRTAPASFDDHFSQARMFYLSLSEVERDHIIDAFTFELGKCYEQAIKERALQVLANVDADLTAKVAEGLGLPAPAATVDAGGRRAEPGPVPDRPAVAHRRPGHRDHRRRDQRPGRGDRPAELDRRRPACRRWSSPRTAAR